jgi:probable F420-dependent oxidoreductase
MQVGATYPQTEIEADPGAVRHYTQAVEAMGYTHILAYDHVLGANTASRPGWNRPYRLESQFHEPFTLFSYMAGVSSKLGFVTGIMILTQRQTALVAKQAACLDVLCGGRFRLGIGTGWNEMEYEALGMPFADRGARIEEQVAVLRALWTQAAVTFKGAQHSIPDAGINPLPVQRPVPIWFGGGSDRPQFGGARASMKVLRRIARLGDGWIPQNMPLDRMRELFDTFRGFCKEYGRDPNAIGIEARLNATAATESGWAEQLKGFRSLGSTHAAVNTMGDGLKGVDAHLKRLEAVRKAISA